jgi:Ca-activated chloride channel family protein
MSTSLLSRPRAGLCADRAAVPLEHVEVRAEIHGAHARVTCSQRYRNRDHRPIEAVYVFPLDESAAVCGFAAVVNGVRFEGCVRPRDEAFAKYDDAMSEGHGAFLLDEERPDVFTASIGNLEPGAEVQIELTYVTELSCEGESLRFMLPTTVAPRYAPPEDRVGIGRSPEQALNPPRRHDVPYGLSFTATVTASSAVRRIESPSHPIAVDVDGHCATVTLAQEAVALDRDVVVLITTREIDGPQIILERGTNGRVTAALTFRPSFQTARVPDDIAFLVDRSGSMQGSSIEQVRNALQLCLRSLDEGCRFNIVGFGSAFESLFEECREYNDGSLAEANRYVASLGATLGGTNLLPALDFVLEHGSNSKRVLQLIVMTDGEVTNADAVIEAVRQRRDQVRVFTFGIGRGASHHVVKGLARAGRGAAEFVYPGERIEPKVLRQLRRALSPTLSDARIDWGGLATTIPGEVGPVFADDPLRAYAFLDEVPEGRATLWATGPDGPLSWFIDIRPTMVADGRIAGILAARARIRELEEGGTWRERGSRQRARANDRVVSEIERLGTEYGLASRETSWVAIEKRDVPTLSEAVLRKVPIAVTSGWGGEDIRFGGGSRDTGQFDTAAFDAMLLAAPEFRMPLGRVERRAPGRASSHQPSAPGWIARLRSRLGGNDSHSDASQPSPDVSDALQRPVGALRPLDVLIALQRADGAWELDQALANAIGVPLGELQRRVSGAIGNIEEAQRAWATALALSFLERDAASSRDEWALLAAKARRWLDDVKTQPPGGGSWREFAGKMLSASRG